jgi:hypothetical protein
MLISFPNWQYFFGAFPSIYSNEGGAAFVDEQADCNNLHLHHYDDHCCGSSTTMATMAMRHLRQDQGNSCFSDANPTQNNNTGSGCWTFSSSALLSLSRQ